MGSKLKTKTQAVKMHGSQFAEGLPMCPVREKVQKGLFIGPCELVAC